jgi:serine phosphatase RsbU (regulator of sigma subunit)
MPRSNTELYAGGVIQIVSDYSGERAMLRRELLKFILIFGLTLAVVIVLLYRKTKVITDPIKRLVMNVNRITDGHLNERAAVMGNNEITRLSEKFNIMIEQLEEYYNELEQKVRERTAEIEKQKEEIMAQRDSLEEQRNMLSEANANLTTAYSEIEEKNRHIEDSIRYAKRIQNAILPPDQYVKRLFEDYFILYIPKDIVSGDFYWVSHNDNRVYIAAVDCTGHGVPGAFMSIVGHDRLNYAVNVAEAEHPSDILNSLNKGVTDTLRQTRSEISVKDGMDIALLSFDFDNDLLEYAGAFNPLYHIRDNELLQVPADKFPIGAFVGEELNKFQNNEIKLKKGDIFYVFSDGYADQFGGPKNKKFMTKRFRDMLLEIHKKPMNEQKETLTSTIKKWMGEAPQVDDILVIGVKI